MEIMQNKIFLGAILVCGIVWGVNGYIAIHRAPVLLKKIASQSFQTPTENLPVFTGNWRTYTNSEWGISFQYPSDGKIDTTYSKKAVRIQNYDYSKISDGLRLPEGFYYITAGPNTDIDCRDHAKNAESYKMEDGGVVYIYKDEDNVESEGKTLALCAQDYNSAFGMAVTRDFYSNSSISQAIFSTFKFTNQNSTSTSGWKTFSDPDWGISVQYPSSYKGGGVQEELQGGSPIVLATFTPPDYVTEYSTTITLGVQQKSWTSIDELYKYEQTYGQHVKSLNRIKVNGFPALDVVSAFGPPEPEDHKVYILYGDTTYYFDFNGSTNDPDYPDFLKMLSTFEIEDRV